MHFSLLSLCLLIIAVQSQSTCDAACQAAFKAAYDTESALFVAKDISKDPFYNIPANATPGTLIQWQQISNEELARDWKIPAGMSLSRFSYMSEDQDGSPLPATAFALVPVRDETETEPLKTVVWAHGTTGRARICAPSNHKELYYGNTVFNLVKEGYAVIGPDYTGLGSDIPQGLMYEAGFVHAADVLFSLVAARKSNLGAQLSDDWIIAGHSEGGLTAWRTNERLAMPNQDKFSGAGTLLAAVAISPALLPLQLIPESFRRAKNGPVGYPVSVYWLQSLIRLYPNELKAEDYYAAPTLGRLELEDVGCLASGRVLFSNFTVEELYKNTSWLEEPVIREWQDKYEGAGPYPLAVPMLVVQGIDDALTYRFVNEGEFNKTCTKFPSSNAELVLYEGQGHGLYIPAEPDYHSWIADRFAGVPTKSGCSIETRPNPA